MLLRSTSPVSLTTPSGHVDLDHGGVGAEVTGQHVVDDLGPDLVVRPQENPEQVPRADHAEQLAAFVDHEQAPDLMPVHEPRRLAPRSRRPAPSPGAWS